jgi:N-acetylmuramoyl-L-alanine amidase
MGFLEPGDTAVITGRYEQWFQIDFNGTTGWVAGWIVNATNVDNVPQVEPPSETEDTTPTAAPDTGEATPTQAISPTTPVEPTVTAGVDGANIRTGPGTEFELVGRLEPGATAPITGRYGDWLQIDFNGTVAWVANWVVTATGVENVPEVEPPVATATPEPTAEPTEASS